MVFVAKRPGASLEDGRDALSDVARFFGAAKLGPTTFLEVIRSDKSVPTGVEARMRRDFPPRDVDADNHSVVVEDRNLGGQRGEDRPIELFAAVDRADRP